MADNRGDKRAHNSTATYYKFVSLYDSDHDGVVRIFEALSCELGGFLNFIILRGTMFPLQECFVPIDRAFSCDVTVT